MLFNTIKQLNFIMMLWTTIMKYIKIYKNISIVNKYKRFNLKLVSCSYMNINVTFFLITLFWWVLFSVVLREFLKKIVKKPRKSS